jgi:hypothetical protein
MVVRAPWALLIALAGCAHRPPEEAPGAIGLPPSTATTTPAPRSQPIPADLVQHVEQSRRLGRAIFLQDVVSARGTDVLLEAGLRDPRIRGWVTQGFGDGRWLVQFVMPEGDHYLVTHEVRLWGKNPELESFSPPRAISPDAESMFRASQVAAERVSGPCPGRYNPVVLPASLVGETGWLVYRLASTNKADELVMAGHQRFRVSPDGRQILEHSPLSRGCVIDSTTRGVPRGATVVGLTMTQPVADWPLETAFFTSLLYGKPLFLRTARGQWEIDGDEVVYLGP